MQTKTEPQDILLAAGYPSEFDLCGWDRILILSYSVEEDRCNVRGSIQNGLHHPRLKVDGRGINFGTWPESNMQLLYP